VPADRLLAAWFLEQEARALLTRLRRLQPLALQDTMLPAAAMTPTAQVAIERYLVTGRAELAGRIGGYIAWLRGPGAGASPGLMQRRFALVRLRFNEVLSQFDLFADVMTQRSEHENGIFIAGLEALAAEGLTVPYAPFAAPEVICYLDRGPGAAIRRARTRLPGGGESPVAIVRVPRERMVGFGLGASVLHEVGHQCSALLGLVESIRPLLKGIERGTGRRESAGWALWSRWLGEIVSDFWAVGKLGISGSLGLMAVISLPPFFVFRPNADDAHPTPFLRFKLSCALGEALYPHPQWQQLAELWERLYPRTGLPVERREDLATLAGTMPALVAQIVEHRPRSLGGRSLRDILPLAERSPARLAAQFSSWQRRPGLMHAAPPSFALAVLGQARARNELTPEDESRIFRSLLTHWALRRATSLAEFAAAGAAERSLHATKKEHAHGLV
jgi:hypothetical protein